MRSFITFLTLLASCAGSHARAALADQCSVLTAQLAVWQRSTMRLERRMEVTINGEIKARIVDDVALHEGRVTVTPVSREVFDQELDLDHEDGDPAQRFDASCKQFEEVSPGRYRLRSHDGLEQLTVRSDASQLSVEEWKRTQTIRLLWKKIGLLLNATYGPPQTSGGMREDAAPGVTPRVHGAVR